MGVIHLFISLTPLLLHGVHSQDPQEFGYRMTLKTRGSRNVTVPSGSIVIFQCYSEDPIPVNSRIAWLRLEYIKLRLEGYWLNNVKAYIDYGEACLFYNTNYPSLSISFPSNSQKFNVLFHNISEQDAGKWSCRHINLPGEEPRSESNFIYLNVKPPERSVPSLTTLPDATHSGTSGRSESTVRNLNPLSETTPSETSSKCASEDHQTAVSSLVFSLGIPLGVSLLFNIILIIGLVKICKNKSTRNPEDTVTYSCPATTVSTHYSGLDTTASPYYSEIGDGIRRTDANNSTPERDPSVYQNRQFQNSGSPYVNSG